MLLWILASLFGKQEKRSDWECIWADNGYYGPARDLLRKSNKASRRAKRKLRANRHRFPEYPNFYYLKGEHWLYRVSLDHPNCPLEQGQHGTCVERRRRKGK